MEKNPKTGRKENLDLLKAFCIFLVVLGHVAECFLQNNMFTEYSAFNNGLYQFIYSFHMPLMFAISGYVAGMGQKRHEKEKNGSYILKSIVSLYVPYLIFNYLFVIGKLFVLKGTVELGMEALYFGAILPSGVFWFLPALLIIRVVSWLLHKYLAKWEWIVFVLATVVAVVGVVIDLEFFALDRVVQFWICYEAGFLLHLVENKWKCSNVVLGVAGFVMAAVSLVLFTDITSYFAKILIGIGISLFLLVITSGYRWSNPVISLLGTQTMVIYLLHSFVTGPLNSVFNLVLPEGGYAVRLLLQTLILFTFPLIAVFMYKKVKIFAWVEYIFYPNKLVFKK